MKALNDHIVLVPEYRQLAVLANDEQTRATLQSLPGCVLRDVGGNTMALLPWTAQACQLLQNLSYGSVATEALPFTYEYHPRIEGEFAPMPHQIATAAFIILNPRCYVLSEPRTGKTGSLALAMDYLTRSRCVIGAFCIITTMTTMRSVWADTIAKTIKNVKVSVVHGKDREKLLDEPADFYVTNYDSVRLSAKAFIRARREGRIGGFVIDELTHMASTTSQRWKATNSVINGTACAYAIGLTGSPGDNPEAALGMGLMINAKKMPCATKRGWLNRISYQWGDESWKRTFRKDAPEQVFAALQPAIRYKKSDVLKLPPVLKQQRTFDLSGEQKKIMNTLKQQGRILLESGEAITAVNGGVLYGKLLQCALGFSRNDAGEFINLDHAERTQTIIECIQESTRKVVVFNSYKHSIRQRCEEIRKAGMTCEFVDGSVTGAARDDVLHRFQTEPDPHVLVCQPVTMSFGVELSAADTMIFDGPCTAGAFALRQALERLSSVRQKADSISVITVLSNGAEQRAWSMLEEGLSLGESIAKMFEETT